MKTRTWRNVLFTVVIVSCFFLMLEVRQRIRHPHVGFRGMYNSLGFRSQEFSPKKEPGTTRILFVGSSTVFGVTGPVEKTFPFLVGKILRDKMPPRRVETINAAKPAETSYWEVERIEKTLYLNPDILVVMTGYNDSASIYRDFIRINERGDLILTPWYLKLDSFMAHHSVFYVTLRERIAILLHDNPNFAFGGRPLETRVEESLDKTAWFDYYSRYFRNNLELMVKTASEHNIKFVFIKPPLGIQRRQEHPLYYKAYLRLMKELVDVASEHHIALIDLDSFFSESKSKEYIGVDGLHFTDAGNLAIAKAVSDFFLLHEKDYFP